MDFVFDLRQTIGNLTTVDNATNDAVAIMPERVKGGLFLTRILDHLVEESVLPGALRKGNRK